MLWLAIIVILGSLTIILDYTLVHIIICIEKRRKLDKYLRIEWFTNDLMKLQRLAHEELHFGTWTDCTGPKAVLVTEKGELLAVINMEDPAHPRLQVKSSLGSNVDKYETLDENSDSGDSTHIEERSNGLLSENDNDNGRVTFRRTGWSLSLTARTPLQDNISTATKTTATKKQSRLWSP